MTFNPFCPGGFTACAVCGLGIFSPTAEKQQLLCLRAYYFHFYWRQSHQTLHAWLKINRKHYVGFSTNMIPSPSFNSQLKMKKRNIWGVTTVSKVVDLKLRNECENSCYFHTILPTGFTDLLTWRGSRISYIGVKITVFTNEHLILNLECVASALAHDVEEICKIRRKSAKFCLTVTHGNSWR